VGIADVADKIAGSLPYTQERLVGIARALALEPKFLMLDEPAAGMNDAEGAQLVDLITRIPAQYGCGVLLIEHNMPVVMSVCERLHVLRGGRTLAFGPREEVRRNPEVIESYLGSH
jgi:branched-chain amino acid transport system ATP-binding protein